ncbi:MAG TPA: YfhO family protein [Bryobacteraceae bacterium]|nr:YfhO family protein [Bryobacteraceae bacterium]
MTPRNRLELQKSGADFYTRFLTCEPAAKYLKSLPGFFRVEIIANPTPAIGDAFSIRTTTGGTVTFENSFKNLFGRSDLLNAHYALKPASTPDPGEIYGEIYRDANWKIYENKNAFPPAWIVHSTIVNPSVELSSVDLHRVALSAAPLSAYLERPRADDSGNINVDRIAAGEVELHTNALAPGLLVISELYYPGWRATVNGKSVTIQLADRGLRAIPIPAGNATIVMRYTPFSIALGALLSICGITIVIALVILDKVRRHTLDTESAEEISQVIA